MKTVYVVQTKIVVIVRDYGVDDFGMDQQIEIRNTVAKVGGDLGFRI